MVRRGGTVSLNGLPPGNFPLDIFGMVLNGITVRGSIVGTRLDLQESLQFAAEGKVAATVSTDRLENINDVFARDRKSTRLNSSHSQISYAVFCLKKKNK